MSLVELLCVIAIICVLSAILFPTFASAKRSAKITSSVSKLRQLHLGAMLYQSNYEGSGYGTLADMGLPSALNDEGFLEMVPTHNFYFPSPCGQNPMWVHEAPVLFQYIYKGSDGGPDVVAESNLYRENFLLFYDLNCDFPGVSVYNPRLTHFGIGVTLGGQLIRKVKKGEIEFSPEWWTTPPDGVQ